MTFGNMSNTNIIEQSRFGTGNTNTTTPERHVSPEYIRLIFGEACL